MKRLTNLREVARKKIFSYVKMGLIIHLPNEVNHYARLDGEIRISKESKYIMPAQPEQEQEVTEEEITSVTVYRVFTNIHVWDDKVSYDGKHFDSTYSVEIEIRDLETFPSDPQALIYAKYKTTLHSYTDDI